jgi:hypothetical protein
LDFLTGAFPLAFELIFFPFPLAFFSISGLLLLAAMLNRAFFFAGVAGGGGVRESESESDSGSMFFEEEGFGSASSERDDERALFFPLALEEIGFECVATGLEGLVWLRLDLHKGEAEASDREIMDKGIVDMNEMQL